MTTPARSARKTDAYGVVGEEVQDVAVPDPPEVGLGLGVVAQQAMADADVGVHLPGDDAGDGEGSAVEDVNPAPIGGCVHQVPVGVDHEPGRMAVEVR
ncbi:hypothetical protein ABZX74_45605 [Streptomyces olivaceoviridis]|uniref:hypothetical protein n=1 Tax=Streptomyces olivaceoviridis TaxID=1921 RepID=UPI0033B82EBD